MSTGHEKQEAPSETVTTRTVAVIDIGATAVRMAIAEIDDVGGVRKLENLSQAVSLGKDAFISGKIGKSTIEECVRVLKIYRQKLHEYQIDDNSSIRIVATSAVREASNRMAFLDRVFVATGFEIEPFDNTELHRVTFLCIQPYLAEHPALAEKQIALCEVGGGNTELMVVQGESVSFFESYRLGSLRLRKSLEAFHAPTSQVREIMESHIEQTASKIKHSLQQRDELVFLAMGGDVRFAATEMGIEDDEDGVRHVPLDQLRSFAHDVSENSVEQLVRKYHLSIPEAESLAPALLSYVSIAEQLGVADLIVTDANLRDGLLREMASRSVWSQGFARQIASSAIDLGRKFHFDEAHASHVAEISKRLFQQLKAEHQLDDRYELILYVAAILHEVGLFISNRSFHKHSMYLIRNSELFGLGRRDVLRVALVARYHPSSVSSAKS